MSYLCEKCSYNNNGWCGEKRMNGLKKKNIQECDSFVDEDTEIEKTIEERYKNDDGTRYTTEEIIEMRGSDNIDWNIILMALGYKMQQIEQKIMICNCCEEYTHELNNTKAELEIYRKEYRKVLIEQQKSNK